MLEYSDIQLSFCNIMGNYNGESEGNQMRKRKTSCRIFAAITASVLLFGSITAFAAPPTQANDPAWKDVFELMEYVGQNYYERNPEEQLDADDVSSELPYYKSGTLIGSALKEKAYAAYVEENGAFSEKNQGEESAKLTGDAASNYAAFYAAGTALVDSLKTATGTKYIDDIVGDWERFWTNQDEPLWEKVDNGQILPVRTEDDAPDTASMEPGTYWVLESDLEAYGNVIGDENAAWRTWDEQNLWEAHNGGPDIARSDLENCINTVTTAYNTLLDKLHEGTKKTQNPSAKKPLAPAEEGSPASAGEESPVPVTVNEVIPSDGSRIQSSLEGVYCDTFVSGVIYKDQQEKIKQAGLTEKEIRSGTFLRYYICNSSNKAINKILSQAVSVQGYRLLGIMNNDLYKLNKSGIHLIKTTSEPLTVMIGVPSYLRNGQYDFSIFCYDEYGNLIVMDDIDTDKATITVQAKSFGYWAVGYRNKK